MSLVILHDYKHIDFQTEMVPGTHIGEHTERLTLLEEESSIYKLQLINVKKIECIAMWFTLHSIIKENNSYFHSILINISSSVDFCGNGSELISNSISFIFPKSTF